LYDHRSGADERILADGDAGQQSDIRSDLGAALDGRPLELFLDMARAWIAGIGDDDVGLASTRLQGL